MKSLGPAVPELIILPVYSALPSEMQVGGHCSSSSFTLGTCRSMHCCQLPLCSAAQADLLTYLPCTSHVKPNPPQTRIFEPAPPGTRKCVIATNIAEVRAVLFFRRLRLYCRSTAAVLSRARARARRAAAELAAAGTCPAAHEPSTVSRTQCRPLAYPCRPR